MSWRSRIVGHDRVDPQSLTGHPLNHRLHPQKQRDVVRDSIAQFGFCKSILVNRQTGYIIDGHERVWQALDAQESDPTVTVDVEYVDLSEDEERAVLAVLDASTEMAEVDQDKLDALLDGIAFESDAIDELIDTLKDDRRVEVVEDGDSVPEVPVEPVTKTGDLWLLGDHRLLCGDSTNADDVARLMDGQDRIDLAFTSPPYNVGGNTMGGHLKASDSHSKYINGCDQLSDDKYMELLNNMLNNMLDHCNYAVINIQMLAANKKIVIEWLYEHRSRFADVAIWNKTHGPPAMGDNILNAAFEFMFIFSCEQNPSRRISTASFRCNVQNVYTQSRGEKNAFADVHAATFPVHLPAWVIDTMSNKGDVLDVFCGTGTTIIAAEQLGRRCFGMELSPQYCDIIVERWENLTGEKAICQPKT